MPATRECGSSNCYCIVYSPNCLGQETMKGGPLRQTATCPPVYHTRWRLHTVLFNAERQAEKLWILMFMAFDLTRPEIEPGSTVSIANALINSTTDTILWHFNLSFLQHIVGVLSVLWFRCTMLWSTWRSQALSTNQPTDQFTKPKRKLTCKTSSFRHRYTDVIKSAFSTGAFNFATVNSVTVSVNRG